MIYSSPSLSIYIRISFGKVTGYIATVLCLATASSDVDSSPSGFLSDADAAIILSQMSDMYVLCHGRLLSTYAVGRFSWRQPFFATLWGLSWPLILHT